MSSVVIKSEEIIVDANEYNSDDVDEELNLTYEDTGGELYHQGVGYTKSLHHSRDVISSGSMVSSQQLHRSDMNIGSASDQGVGGKNSSPKNILESEKRMRREIANSNERRRMQSINAGFQNLRALLPRHEGEKLSKAAILQQTSQYICDLENQKTQLLAQNSQLKRTLGQHELALSGGGYGSGVGGNVDDGCSAIKKRKLTDNVISLQTISDSSDEGLGSVSPEPTTLLQQQSGGNSAGGGVSLGLTKAAHGNAYITHSAKELLELKKQLEKERRMRAAIEEELRVFKRQRYSDNYVTRGIVEHPDNLREEEVTYVINAKNEPTEVVVCSAIDEINDECAEIITDENIHEEVILAQETEIKYADSTALQPILQAAIKAQPKVEVERINETVMKIEKDALVPTQKKAGSNPIGLTRSRQNLETIVEAIRHLEGDHLFGESAGQQKKAQKSQESPLALTTKQLASTTTTGAKPIQHHQQQQQRKTIAELSPFLQIKNPKIGAGNHIVTIVRGRSIALAPSGDNSVSISSVTNPSNHSTSAANTMPSNSSNNNNSSNSSNSTNSIIPTNSTTIPTAIVKVQSSLPQQLSTTPIPINPSASHITITSATLKQCRPGVIVSKQTS